MRKRSELKKYIKSMEEIKNIIAAMKNLSLIELSKINKFIDNQNNVVATIKDALVDFMAFNSDLSASYLKEQVEAYILIGSERGFCGDFNERIIKYALKIREDKKTSEKQPLFICVGRKLITKFADTAYEFESVDGPNAAEEIQATIYRLVRLLAGIHQKTAGNLHSANWVIIANDEIQNAIQTIAIKPFAALLQNEKNPSYTFPPLLNLTYENFIADALDQYLYATLHKIFYNSFLMENKQRLMHMEGAIKWLEKNNTQLLLAYNQMRQEEIVEEIEVVLLSAKAIIDEHVI